MYTKAFVAGLFLIFFNTYIIAQSGEEQSKDTTWKFNGHTNINFSQVGLNNWAGGGESSVSLSGILNLSYNMVKEKSSWKNGIDVAYGVVRQGDHARFVKSNDQLRAFSDYSKRLSERWSASAGLDFRTQMRPGYRFPEGLDGEDILISNFMAPGYILSSVGIEYNQKEWLTVSLSPATGKYTFVLQEMLAEQGAFGVEPGEQFRAEIGSSVHLAIQKKLMENVNLKTRWKLFSNYERAEHIDVNGEFLLNMKVNKFITTSVSAELIYDDDIDIERDDGTTGAATQFKETINVGFYYDL